MSFKPKLTHVFDIIAYGPPGFATAPSKYSNQCCAHVTGGKVVSADGRHELDVNLATDWMTITPENPVISIDARLSATSKEGDNLDFAYLGKIKITEDLQRLFTGDPEAKETQFGDGYYYTTPRISSRSEKFAWVNDSVFLAMGKIKLNEKGLIEVVYRIMKVA